MPLTWNTEKCKELSDEDWEFHYIMCMMLMAIYIGEITEKNVDEVYARQKFLEKFIGSWYSYIDDKGERKEGHFTPQDIKKWIGLSINQRTMTRRQWLSLQAKNFTRDLDDYIREFRKEN